MKMQKATSMENVPWSELGKQNVKAEKVYNSNALRMEVNRKLTNIDKINQLSYKSTHYRRDLRAPLAAIFFTAYICLWIGDLFSSDCQVTFWSF